MLKSLTYPQIGIAQNTISAYAFYYLVADALLSNKKMSVVRMGDGEHDLLLACNEALKVSGKGDSPVACFDEAWRTRMGIEGITYSELYVRLLRAGDLCTHFAPSISGLADKNYFIHNFFNHRDRYIDNFFVNIWSMEQKEELFLAAQKVLFIHRNVATADAMQHNCRRVFGFYVPFIRLNSWQDTEDVIAKAQDSDARLVLFAGGPAGKYIAPEIANSGKVVLDIGNTTDHWTFADYKV